MFGIQFVQTTESLTPTIVAQSATEQATSHKALALPSTQFRHATEHAAVKTQHHWFAETTAPLTRTPVSPTVLACLWFQQHDARFRAIVSTISRQFALAPAEITSIFAS